MPRPPAPAPIGPTAPASPGDSLRHSPDFLRLWAGETVSLVGSQVTLLALPLTAALILGAGPLEVGILTASGHAPFLLFGLLAGVWVDRRRRRPIMVGADLGRAALLATIPAAAVFGVLRIEHLILVAFAVGTLTVLFDISYMAYLPVLVRREQLVSGNATLEMSRSVAQIAGPGLAGGLVQALGGPLAIAADAASYLVSATSLASIRAPEPTPSAERRGSVRQEIAEGLRAIFGNPALRAIATCTSVWNLFGSAAQAVFILFLLRDLGMAPALTGLVMTALGPGALLGAVLAGRIARRFGVGPTIVGAPVLGLIPAAVIPLAAGPPSATLPLLMAALFLQGLIGTVYNVTQVSLRQALVPDQLQGRMNATMRFVVWGTLPLGALAGGALGEAVGLRPVLVLGLVGVALAALAVGRSPLRRLREPPPDRPGPAT